MAWSWLTLDTKHHHTTSPRTWATYRWKQIANNGGRRIFLSVLLIGFLVAPLAAAQVAPTGGHQAARPSDTGFSGLVNSTGGYSTSVALDILPAKNGLPLPVGVIYGSRGVGAAGMGWDVPVSYIVRDTTYAHRLPAYDASLGSGASQPFGSERLTLVMDGQAMLLMRKGNQQTSTTWVPVYDGPQIEVHENTRNGEMLLYDGAGRTYTFVNSGPVGPPGTPPQVMSRSSLVNSTHLQALKPRATR
jgi:hypothetical protein